MNQPLNQSDVIELKNEAAPDLAFAKFIGSDALIILSVTSGFVLLGLAEGFFLAYNTKMLN